MLCAIHLLEVDGEQRRRRKRGMLKMYYGLEDEDGKEATTDPIDIDGAHFDPDVYLARLMREKRLTELVDREVDMVKRKFLTPDHNPFWLCVNRNSMFKTHRYNGLFSHLKYI